MYVPGPFAETRLDVLHDAIRQAPLATLVTSGSAGPNATHLPLVLHPEIGPKGTLRGHMARPNTHWKDMISACPVLAIFQGPDHYITPSWYPSKQEHGKVVPTWNYVAVHVRGQAQTFEEPDALLAHVRSLTDQHEAAFERRWSVEDAPSEFIQNMLRGIVGIKITIESIEGKWKLNQNRPEADRRGVVEGLQRLNTPESLAVAELMNKSKR